MDKPTNFLLQNLGRRSSCSWKSVIAHADVMPRDRPQIDIRQIHCNSLLISYIPEPSGRSADVRSLSTDQFHFKLKDAVWRSSHRCEDHREVAKTFVSLGKSMVHASVKIFTPIFTPVWKSPWNHRNLCFPRKKHGSHRCENSVRTPWGRRRVEIMWNDAKYCENIVKYYGNIMGIMWECRKIVWKYCAIMRKHCETVMDNWEII